MAELPVLRSREVVAALGRAGFFVHHQSGSHAVLRHRTDASRRVTVPMHSRDLKRGTLRSIVREAGLSVDQFVRLL
jgi:predicted RNA binding protein YcfA (HicA-like mRNA interferase family)